MYLQVPSQPASRLLSSPAPRLDGKESSDMLMSSPAHNIGFVGEGLVVISEVEAQGSQNGQQVAVLHTGAAGGGVVETGRAASCNC